MVLRGAVPVERQKAFGNPACSSTPFAVCRLTIPTGTGKRRPVIGFRQIS